MRNNIYIGLVFLCIVSLIIALTGNVALALVIQFLLIVAAIMEIN